MSQYRYTYEQPGRFARGWYIVSFSQELAKGEIKKLHYFNQDLVLFRGDDGKPAVLDAYCPHLGAHLGGTGATVIGNSIRCPFHGWQFDGCGTCVKIPYANKIPPRASTTLKGWPIVEKNGFIAIWYDPAGAAPGWELPDIGHWSASSDWRFKRKPIKTRGFEIVENIVDSAHFPFVHGGRVDKWEIEFADHTVTQRSIVSSDATAVMIVPEGLPFDLVALRKANLESGLEGKNHEGWATYFGPSIMYFNTIQGYATFSYDAFWVNYYTPVSDKELELTSGVIIRQHGDEPVPQEFIDLYPEVAFAAFSQDIEIWETKIYRADPVLCDGDGPITKLRKWYEQFYL